MNCPSCGAMNPPYAPVCTYCGSQLAAPPPAYGQPPYQGGYGGPPPGPYGGGGPVISTAPRFSGMAIAGFILSFFCGLLGLILSIIALSQIGRSMGMLRGRGLAVAGIIISVVTMLAGISLNVCGRSYRHRRIHRYHMQLPTDTDRAVAARPDLPAPPISRL